MEHIELTLPRRFVPPQTSLIFFLGVLFLSTLSVKEISERVPSRARSEDVDSISEEEGEDVFETPRKALFDHSDSEDDGFRTAKQKKEQLGSELTPHGRRSRRLQQTAEKKKKNL